MSWSVLLSYKKSYLSARVINTAYGDDNVPARHCDFGVEGGDYVRGRAPVIVVYC